MEEQEQKTSNLRSQYRSRYRSNQNLNRNVGKRRVQDEKTSNYEAKKSALLLQTYVSIIMLVSVICITLINTTGANSIEKKLKSAIEADMSMKSWVYLGESIVETALDIKTNAGEFLSSIGIRKRDTNENTQNIEENKEKNLQENSQESSQENAVDGNKTKNQIPPEVILPES